MKKLLTVFMILFLVIGMTACGGDDSGGSDGNGDASAPIVIKSAHVDSEEGPIHQSFVRFKEYVEAESDGQITVEIYPNAELGGDRQVVEALALGTVQMTAPSPSSLTLYDDKFSVISLPFLFDSEEQMEEAISGEFGDLISLWMEDYGFKCYGYQFDGSRCISNSKKPIEKVEDLQGLKIRVMESPIYVDMFKLMGANPSTMSFNEIYTGLQQGVVDGQDNPPGLTYTSKFYEAQDYYSLTRHVYSNCPVMFSKAFIDGLSDENRAIVETGAREYLHTWNREESKRMESEYIQMMEEAGVAVNEISPENLQGFKDALQPIYDQYRELIGEDMDTALNLIN